MLKLTYDPANPWFVEISNGKTKLPLCIAAGVHGTKDYDGLSHPKLAESKDGHLAFEFKSTRWEKHRVTIDVVGDAVEFQVHVRGKGEIESVSYLEGALAENFTPVLATIMGIHRRPRPLRAYSIATPVKHREVFTPQPDSYPRPYRRSFEEVAVTSATTFGPDVFNTYFSPGIFCLVLSDRPGWRLGAGVCAQPGTNNYHTFRHVGGDVFGFMLDYDGMVSVDGDFSAPKLRLSFAEDETAAIRDYVSHLRNSKLVHADPKKKIPSWWKKPIYCGWGQQVAWGRIAEKREKLPFDSGPVDTSADGMCTQACYERMIDILEKHDIPFGTMVIDAGWSTMKAIPTTDTKKWPDLRGFIDKQHKKGHKVMLWMSCWSGNDCPVDYLMDCDANLRGVTDPTKQNFIDAVTMQITHFISPKGMDADGFKLDFTGDIPRGKGYRPAKKNLWGMEMLHDYVSMLHRATKAAKPDAMMMTHCGNPYFADNTDVLRLNDIYFEKVNIDEQMAFRGAMARLACPEWLIDCDNDPFADHNAWLSYMRVQPQIGIPSLYTLTNQSMSVAPIPPADLDEVSRIWKKYLAELEAK